MSFDIRCWSATGQMTFSAQTKTIRQQEKIYIPSGASGSVPLWMLPNGIDGVLFDPVSGSSNQGVAPYAIVQNGALQYWGGVGDFYLTVLSVAT